jgi:hypothetical protein
MKSAKMCRRSKRSKIIIFFKLICKKLLYFHVPFKSGRDLDEEKGRRQLNKPEDDLECRRSKCLSYVNI